MSPGVPSDPSGPELFRERAAYLRRFANRPESSLREALLEAALEWDARADQIEQRLNAARKLESAAE